VGSLTAFAHGLRWAALRAVGSLTASLVLSRGTFTARTAESGVCWSPMRHDRISHRIEITSVADIDDEVKRWLGKAYELDA